MGRQAPIDPSALRLGADLRRAGIEPARANWVRVRRGVWLPASVWESFTPSQEHAARVYAASLVLDDSAVFCHAAAAAVWGLPRIEDWPVRVDVLSTIPRPRGSGQVVKHAGPECEAVAVGHIRLTPVARTVVDLARWHSLETAVAAADHALRHRLCTRGELDAEAGRLAPRSKGRPAARLVCELADPDAESPGESLSRVQMFRHNIPRPQLQVPLEDEEGLFGRGDFGWGDLVVGEFDGRSKYRVPADASPTTASEVLWREKRREDRIRRSGRRVARWVFRDARRGHPMVAIIARSGVRPVTPRVWFDLGSAPRTE